MAEIVNLRRARKARRRHEQDRKAAQNRARHGRSKAERHSEEAERARTTRAFEGHRREERPERE